MSFPFDIGADMGMGVQHVHAQTTSVRGTPEVPGAREQLTRPTASVHAELRNASSVGRTDQRNPKPDISAKVLTV